MGWIGFVIVFVVLGTLAFFLYATFCIGSGVYEKVWCKGNTQERVVCLTFDDGPHEVYTPQVLDVLKQYQAPATFFCIGKNAESQIPLLKRMNAEGHLVGNHSYSHTWKFPFMDARSMYSDLLEADECITKAQLGLPFRPPFGVMNPTVVSTVRKLGSTIIGWNIRSFDTVDKSENRVFRRIARQIKPGAIILLHDRMPGSASLLVRLLDHLKEINYKVIPLDEMVEIPNPFNDPEDA